MEELSDFVFFRALYDFIHSEIDEFAIDLLARTTALVSTAALSVLTLWILIRGYRIVTGQSHQPMMGLVTDALRTTLILGLACGMSLGGSTLYEFLGSDLPNEISRVVTGDAVPLNEQIDRNLALMQIAVGSIDALDVMGDTTLDAAKDRASWFAGLGTAGPAMSGGSLLLMNQIALALFIGLAPLFVLSLLFEQTKGLFGKWLYYGIGTMFSLAVLSVIVGIALDMVLKVGAAFWTSGVLMGSADGLTSLAMQQGCLGLVLTILILSAPPMAAQFFNGVLGNFSPKSVFGGGAERRSQSENVEPIGYRSEEQIVPINFAFRESGGAVHQEEGIKHLPESNTHMGLSQDHFKAGSGMPASLLLPVDLSAAAAVASAAIEISGTAENTSPPIDTELQGLERNFAPPWVLEQIDRGNLNVFQGQVTFNAEGNDNPDSPYYSRELHWPGGASGVTLGRGYDMRYRTQEQVRTDLLAAGVDTDAADNFAGGAGLSGVAARDFVSLHRDEYGEISRRMQRRLFEDVVYPGYEENARNQYATAAACTPGAVGWDELDPRIRDIATDLTYQQGSIWRRKMPNILQNDRNSLADYIETTPELSRYEAGRHRANYLRGE